MQSHEERVANELNELRERRQKLAVFIGANPLFRELPGDEQDRMQRQLIVMGEYQKVLPERVDHFPKPEA